MFDVQHAEMLVMHFIMANDNACLQRHALTRWTVFGHLADANAHVADMVIMLIMHELHLQRQASCKQLSGSLIATLLVSAWRCAILQKAMCSCCMQHNCYSLSPAQTLIDGPAWANRPTSCIHCQGYGSSCANGWLMVQLAEAEAELDAMTKDRDELQAVVDELQEKVTHLLPPSADSTCRQTLCCLHAATCIGRLSLPEVVH